MPEGTAMHEKPLSIQFGDRTYSLSYKFRAGGNDLLVFIHGLGCSKEAFDDAWRHPAIQEYSLLSYDLLGFGTSDQPRDVAYTLENQATILDQVLARYSSYHTHLVANSWGPLIGLLLPEATLAKLASFINLEGRLVIDDVGNAKKATTVSPEEFERTFWPELTAKYHYDTKTAYLLNWTLPQAYYQGARSIVEHISHDNFPERFLRLTCTKAYVYGDQNRHLKSLTVIPGVATIEISNAGHFMMKDNPKEFYQKLANFLAQISRD